MKARNHIHPPPLLQQGFSLIELMVGISVLSILLTIAIPSFRNFTQSASVDAVQSSFYNALLFARSEAIKRNKIVIVCRRQAAQNQCNLPATNDWSEGWLVYVDAQDDSDVIISGILADKILKTSATLANDTSFTRLVSGTNPLRSTICFNGYGMLCSDKDQQSDFMVDAKNEANGKYRRQILISIVGKISLKSYKH